jgi:hypothetical protein
VTNPRHVQTSVVKKSAPAISPQCARRNVCHDVERSGTGEMPRDRRIRAIVDRPTSYPTFLSAPWIRVYPHVGFSAAIRPTSWRISARTPRRAVLFLAYVHLRAINCRCQRSNVSGVTIVATSRKAHRPSRYARAASFRRVIGEPWTSAANLPAQDPILLDLVSQHVPFSAI